VPPPVSEQDLAYIVGLYDGEIQYMDDHLGRLLDTLDELPTKRELVSVVTADHGEEFLDHGAFNHGYTLYEEQISVPLIISEPSRLKPRRVAQQVRLVDIAPTLLDLARVPARSVRFQGRSVTPLMDGGALPIADAFSEATNFGDQRAVRNVDSLKLIHSLTGPQWWLFDLAMDPGEKNNLSVQRRDSLQSLTALLDAWQESNRVLRAEIGASGTGLDQVVLDEKTKKGLEALGYIDP
jgi:arylsulfatase A-like enzyme